MIVKKSEFREMFGFNNLQSITQLLKRGVIVAQDDGMIDLEKPKNKKWIKARKKELLGKEFAQDEEKSQSNKQADETQIGVQISLLNQKLEEQRQKSTLLDLKIAREKKEVIETEVMDRVLMTVFKGLFQNLAELPSIYVDDLVNIIKTDKSPKEQFVKFLTDKIVSQMQNSLDVAENAIRKHYEDC